jgi:hypothetical protein
MAWFCECCGRFVTDAATELEHDCIDLRPDSEAVQQLEQKLDGYRAWLQKHDNPDVCAAEVVCTSSEIVARDAVGTD